MKPIHRDTVRLIGLLAGPALAVIAIAALPTDYVDRSGDTVHFSFAGRATVGLMLWMATWWITEAIDVSATALLPLVYLPFVTLTESVSATKALTIAAAPYADPFIFLFMGGFVLALSLERWNLHRRIALLTLGMVGTRPAAIVGGFMAITAVISMWVSNTATVAMMLPIAMSVIGLIEAGPSGASPADRRPATANLAVCLMLGIAYAASIGGVGTLIGTPPNTLLAGFIQKEYGQEVSFLKWLAIGTPLVLVFIPVTWLVLTRLIYPVDRAPIEGGRELFASQRSTLGRMKPGEVVTFVVFMLTAAAWMFRPVLASIEIGAEGREIAPFAGLSDPLIAMLAAMALFVIPVSMRPLTFTMDWRHAARLPWGVLILFGGGLSMADAATTHGVAEFIGSYATLLAGLPALAVVVIVTAGVVFLSELTSNTAATAALLPILAGLAPGLGVDPYLLLVPAAIAASCAFMMPAGTPPNAMVFATGHVTIPQMCRAGLWLNLIGIVLITAITYLIVMPVLR
jgi:sodium-dependent dicarboxylate transporter 2/3/5